MAEVLLDLYLNPLQETIHDFLKDWKSTLRVVFVLKRPRLGVLLFAICEFTLRELFFNKFIPGEISVFEIIQRSSSIPSNVILGSNNNLNLTILCFLCHKNTRIEV